MQKKCFWSIGAKSMIFVTSRRRKTCSQPRTIDDLCDIRLQTPQGLSYVFVGPCAAKWEDMDHLDITDTISLSTCVLPIPFPDMFFESFSKMFKFPKSKNNLKNTNLSSFGIFFYTSEVALMGNFQTFANGFSEGGLLASQTPVDPVTPKPAEDKTEKVMGVAGRLRWQIQKSQLLFFLPTFLPKVSIHANFFCTNLSFFSLFLLPLFNFFYQAEGNAMGDEAAFFSGLMSNVAGHGRRRCNVVLLLGDGTKRSQKNVVFWF